MPYQISWWDDEQTVVICENSGHWTWTEYNQAIDEVIAMIASQKHSVDFIALSARGAIMPSGSAAPHIQRAMRNFPPNGGWIINVSTNNFSRALVKVYLATIGRRLGDRFKMLGSFEEAVTFLMSERKVSAKI